jgi:hypothetical protein
MVHVSVRGAYVLNTIHDTSVKLPDDGMEMSNHVGVYIIQGVPGGMCETSGECSLGQTIPI